MSPVAEMIGHRSELLAKVVLTRRLNIDVFNLDAGGEMEIDLLCSIRDEKTPSFRPFGVLVWGTRAELDTPEDLAKHVRTRTKHLEKRTRYFFPVIILLFSMHKDQAFFSWLVEPSEGTSHLIDVAGLDFKEFDIKQLDRMTKRISDWYKRLATTIMRGPGEIESPSSREEG
jgi:hypothetical protein